MDSNNTTTGIVVPERENDLLIVELDDRLEFSIMAVSPSPDLQIICGNGCGCTKPPSNP